MGGQSRDRIESDAMAKGDAMANKRVTSSETTADNPEILAQAIVDVATAAKKLLASRLTKRTVLLLIADSSGVSMRQVELVLDHAADLGKYVKR